MTISNLGYTVPSQAMKAEVNNANSNLNDNQPANQTTRNATSHETATAGFSEALFKLDSLLMQLRKFSAGLESIRDQISGDSNEGTSQRGGRGDDVLTGGNGDDTLKGRAGDDTLNGGEGNDRLKGGAGDDTLKGGSGDDVLKGGRGSDTFQFNPANAQEGNDTIRDFEVGKDSIELNLKDVIASTPDGGDGFQVSDLDAPGSGWSLSANANGDVQVNHPGGTITLDNVKLEDVKNLGITSFEGLVEAGVVKAV